MLHRVRTFGSCALSIILVMSLTSILSGFSAQAEEAPLSRDEFGNTSMEEPFGGEPETAQEEGSVDEGTPDAVFGDPATAEDEEAVDGIGNGIDDSSSEPLETETATASMQTDGVQPDRGILIDGSTLYANGVAVTIKRDSDGKLYVFDESGTEKLTPALSSLSTVYGGGKNTPVDGDTNIRIGGVKIGTVYGGGYSDGSGSADVSGNATVTITGNVDAGTVHGGGYANAYKGDASANVAGAASVVVSATPTGNHGNLYGGGSAFSQKGYNASASVGSTYASVAGRTYSLRGGGSAELASGATGSATADVRGHIEVQCTDVDIREVYGAGYANGVNTSATADSVSVVVDGDEAMSVQGGGSAHSGGMADVFGHVAVEIKNCSNLYGYFFGGGEAYNGGAARAGSASVTVRDSAYPVSTQFGSYVAGATFAGGNAQGAGADASISGTVSVAMSDCVGGGNIYGSGDAGSGGNARVLDSRVALRNVSNTMYDDVWFSSVLYAGGETDDVAASPVEPNSVSVSIEASWVEQLAGGVLVGEKIVPIVGKSAIDIVGSANEIQLFACFDTASISSPLHIDSFVGKAPGNPVKLSISGIAEGEPAVVCKDEVSQSNWFSRVGGSLKHAVEEIDGYRSSVWRVGDEVPPGPGAIETVVPEEPGMPSVSVENVAGLADRLLTDEDRNAMEQGSLIGFSLHVAMLEEVPSEVAAVVDQAFAEHGCTLAYHLDIDLVKSVDGVESSVSSVQQTGSRLRFCLEIPQEAIAENRTFSVMRFHKLDDGGIEVTELQDLDGDPATITFETDRFSVYSLVYGDPEPIDPDDPHNPGGDSGGGDNPESPDGNPENPDSRPSGTTGEPDGQDDPKPLPQTDAGSVKRAYETMRFPTTGDPVGDAALAGVGMAVCAALIVASAHLRRRSTRGGRR
ncbi:hypothetical protein [Raoultibacter timonensis]|uniref:hypothetical protein n=1 Tax=Raoultibacter timonensis TaxID=1907662 RepID=UPI0026DCE132|nr:hypothetical protein [Raoultibacter timonensis]